MRITSIAAVSISAVALLGLSASLYSQDKAAPPAKVEEHEEQAAGDQPGPKHAAMAKLSGTWTTSNTLVIPGMDAANAPPPSAGTSTFKSVLDGLFMQEEDSGDMMGMPFSSIKFWGYNNDSGNYEAMWAWSMGTSMMTLKGTSKDDGKTVVYTATYDEGGETQKLEVTVAHKDADHFSVTIVGKGEDPADNVTMMTEYSRKK